MTTLTTFTVKVDYSKSLEEMVNAGHYYKVDPGITGENFPLGGKGKVEVEITLIHWDEDEIDLYYMDDEEIIEEMGKLGLKPCKIEHLLSLGAQHPDLQKEYPIVCLGSSCSCCRTPSLVPGWRSMRELCLSECLCDSDWFSHWTDHRFVAIHVAKE